MAKIKSFDVMVGATINFSVKDGAGTTVVNPAKWFNVSGAFKVKGGIFTFHGPLITLEIYPAKTMKSFTSQVESSFKSLLDLTSNETMVVLDGKDYTFNDNVKIYDAATKSSMMPFPISSGINIMWKKDKEDKWPEVIDPLDNSHMEATSCFAKALDAYLGLPSYVWDEEGVKMKKTSMWSSYTPKTFGDGWHGMTYYGLTNKWAQHTQVCDLVFGNTTDAFRDMMENPELHNVKYYGKSTLDLLNNSQENEDTICGVVREGGKIHDPRYYREQREKAA